MKKYQGVAMGVAGVLLFSSKAVMVKLAYNYEVEVISLLLLRMVFALPIYAGMALMDFSKPERRSQYLNLKTNDWLTLVLLGTIGYYLASWLDFKGLERVDASLERLILFVYPTFVLLISSVVFKKPISKTQLLAITLCYFGVFVMFSDSLFSAEEVKYDMLGIAFIVGSGLTYAMYLVGSQSMMQKINPKGFTNLAMIISCGCVLVHFFLQKDVAVLGLPYQVYVIGFLMAVFATVVPSYLISISINQIGASRLAIIGCLGPVSTISLAMIFLGETLTVTQILGAIIIVSTVVWINLNKQKAT